MLIDKNISIHLSCQQFECNNFEINDGESTLLFTSSQKSTDVVCPFCGGKVHVYDNSCTTLKDMPIWHNAPLLVKVKHHRYRCHCCNRSFSEDICMKCPRTRITYRAAKWISELLRWHLPINAVHEITGIHWDTIRLIHEEAMAEELDWRKKELQDKDYRPKYLAVDEFAIHKGHSYATCVMDLEQGDVIWVGKGRSKDSFLRFFQETDLGYLADVKAVAMDMNASYNILVEQFLPHAEIVYDRYHMQAQYGKDVLGAVRLAEARNHSSAARELENSITDETPPEQRRALRLQARQQRQLYSRLKKSRWTLLTNGESLSSENEENLNAILNDHSDLALCYAMKEEMCSLFELTDPVIAEQRWRKWFNSAKASGIPALVRFAELKEKRIDGLIAHARHKITTGKLEGFNNKIKVAKRIGYGYRNEDYFFTLIRYMSIPAVRGLSPRKT